MTWEILICSLAKRKPMLDALCRKIEMQIIDEDLQDDVKINVDVDNGEATIGAKRNRLLQSSTADYTCFVDDDDDVTDDYVKVIWNALKRIDRFGNFPDVVKFIGIITFDGKNPKKFFHSIAYRTYFETKDGYFRPPNHLNVMKSSIAKKFKFPEKNFSEDTDWAMQIAKTNPRALMIESQIDHPIYYYKFISKK